MRTTFLLAPAVMLAVAAVHPSIALATEFDFSYRTTGGLLTGCLEGSLQSDGNTVLVTSVSMTTFGGSSGPDLPLISSASSIFGGPSAPARVSFDGSVMDLSALTFFADDGFAIASAFSIFFSGFQYGNISEAYDSGAWTLEVRPGAVPEGGSSLTLLALSGGAMFGLGRLIRRS